ncbi:TcpE family conjugal transfer membrane protein [Halobacillus sp. A5]|uniref:TcpE family conjugal transfer membrane protein n=1 Tax=Halobacillus sp. A5 TaxID=2880263 RepID=UPI0020A6CF1F|nr:TcpE family conjugal transfer membrane protein [Halobacillus sp. A5]MCP3029661.1 conjugal transfer protein [Halobacillus sp. A5]
MKVGENFTSEYKYPIKIYRMGSVEFANGLEVRKVIFSILLAALLIFSFVILGIQSDANLLGFVAKNWLILITVIPGTITFVVFNLKYDHKGFIPYVRDRFYFYRHRHKQYEHFVEVAHDQVEKDMSFEPFVVKKEGDDS